MLQEVNEPGKEWAKRFDKLSPFEQIQTLVSLQDSEAPLEVQFQINCLLLERVQRWWEELQKNEKSLMRKLSISNGISQVKRETCKALNEDKTLVCGLPKGHEIETPPTMHKSGNFSW